MEKIKNVSSLCKTTDVWSTTNSYLGTTVHWIVCNTFKRLSRLLVCRRFKGKHSYDAEQIDFKYKITTENIVATITENDSNFVKAFIYLVAILLLKKVRMNMTT